MGTSARFKGTSGFPYHPRVVANSDCTNQSKRILGP